MIRKIIMASDSAGTKQELLYDPFKDGSGKALYRLEDNALDESGNFNGTATNVTYGNGLYGRCFVGDGTNRYIVNSSIFNLITRSTYTISVWAKFSVGTSGAKSIIHAQDKNNANTPIVGIHADVSVVGSILFNLRTNSTSLLNLNVPYTAGIWTHLVVMCTSTGASAYMNGVNVGTATFTPIFTTNSSCSFNIGRTSQDWIPWVGNYFNGSIDQVRIFNRALTQDEVTKLYQNENSPI